jgi:drug/metabolite transporter (DMT)-like permease
MPSGQHRRRLTGLHSIGPARYPADLDHSTEPTRSTPSTLASASPMAIWLGLLTLYFVWGSTYIGIRLAVETIPPFLMAGLRFLISGVALLAWETFATRHLRSDPGTPEADRPHLPSRRELRDSAIVGGLLLFGGMGMVALGEKTVPAGIAAILIALLPVWVAVLGRLFFGERLPAPVIVGIAVGLVGVVILVAPIGTSGGGLAFDPRGIFVLLLSPLCWGGGSLYSSHRAILPRRPLTATGLQMVCGGTLLVIGSILVGELRGFDPATVTTRSWIGLAYLTTVGSLVGFTTFVWLLRVAPLPKIATYAYVNPVVAFVLAGILLGEPIEPRAALAGAIIVFAVALIVTARGRAERGTARPTPDNLGDLAASETVASGAAGPA